MYFSPLDRHIIGRPEINRNRVRHAYRIAEQVHQKQTRQSGEPYIIHPVAVACFLAQHGAENTLLCAALLHDTLEDAEDPEVIAELIYETFGTHVFFLVSAVSKDPRIVNKEARFEYYLAGLKQSLPLDVSLFFLKSADLIHNLQTLHHLIPEKQTAWRQELKDHYFPFFVDCLHSSTWHHYRLFSAILNALNRLMHQKT